MAHAAWDRAWLERQGFAGFVTFAALPASVVPAAPGVYVVYRGSTAPPRFVDVGSGGRFTGRDPNVTGDRLAKAWVVGAHVVYIGKATAGAGGGRGLRTRLDEYRRFGAGAPVGHWGGRYIWQLEEASQLLVAWRPTPAEDPGDVEAQLIAAFTAVHGSRPFANRNRGRVILSVRSP